MHRISILACCLLTLAASAQEPPVPGLPGLPAAPVAPNPALPRAGVAVNPAQVINEDITEPKLDGDGLADYYRKFTGRRVTVSLAASQAEFRFIQPAPLTYGEAGQLLKKAALLEGFVFVPDANMEGHDVLVVGSGGANPKGEGLELVIDPADLPTDDRVVMYMMSLKHIKPEEIVRTFTTIVGQFGAYGSITPIPNAGAVVITEKTSLIRRLITLVEEIDVSASIATRFIKVKYADVQELSDTLNEILNTQQQSQGTARVQRVQNNAAPAVNNPLAAAALAAGASGGNNSAEDVPIQIVPDTRTNRIFAMGRPVDIVFIEGLVREFDTETDERNFLRRKLRFVAVSDFLEIAEPALQRAFGASDSTSAGGGGGSRGGSTGANFGNNRNTSNNNRNNSNNRNSSFGGGNTGSSFGGGGGGGGSSLGDPSINSAPEARLVGRTLLVADNITNSLVVQGPPAGVEIITNLLDQIDVKADQVMISAVFGQLALGDEFNLGVEFVRTLSGNRNGQFAGRGGASGGFGDLPLDGVTGFDPGSLASAAGLGLYGRISENLNVLVDALQSDSRFKVISRPTIYTSNSRKGTIAAGQRIAVPTSTNNFGVGNGGINTNIQYQDVLLSLEVIPLVNSEDEVTLEIALLNDEIVGEQIIEGVGAVPTIGRRELVTTVTVPNGSTIVLGGLISSTNRESVSGIPLLSDIPGLGKIFSRTTTSEDRQELMIFIQPKIVKDAASLYDAQSDMDRRYDVSGETRDFAEGPSVLPPLDQVPTSTPPRATPVPESVLTPRSSDRNRTSRRLLGRPGSPFQRN